MARIRTLGISHAITRLFREQNRIYGRAIQALGVSTEQAHLLMVLWLRGPLSLKELGKEVALSSGTLSTAVDRMEAAGLVERRPDPSDKRATRLQPAAWSKAKRETLEGRLEATEDEILAPLSPDERATLYDLLERVLAGLG